LRFLVTLRLGEGVLLLDLDGVLRLGEGVLRLGEGVLRLGEGVLRLGEGVLRLGEGVLLLIICLSDGILRLIIINLRLSKDLFA